MEFLAIAAIVVIVTAIAFGSCYRSVGQGQALVINTSKDSRVSFTGALVLPIIHRAEVMDISLKTVRIEQKGASALRLKNEQVNLVMTFFVRVNSTTEDVLTVASVLGCARASDEGVIHGLMEAKFVDLIKAVAKPLSFAAIEADPRGFVDEVIMRISEDLNGFVVDDAVVDEFGLYSPELHDASRL